MVKVMVVVRLAQWGLWGSSGRGWKSLHNGLPTISLLAALSLKFMSFYEKRRTLPLRKLGPQRSVIKMVPKKNTIAPSSEGLIKPFCPGLC